MLLDQLTPERLTLSVFLLALNIPLFIFGLKKQGLLFTVYAIYTVGIYSLFAWLITDILPIDVSFTSPLAGEDLLLCALFGRVISGIGSDIEKSNVPYFAGCGYIFNDNEIKVIFTDIEGKTTREETLLKQQQLY